MITDNKCILLSNKIKTIQTFGLTCGTSRYKTPTGIANELLVIGPYILHLYAPNSQTRLLYRKSDFCRFMHLGSCMPIQYKKGLMRKLFECYIRYI